MINLTLLTTHDDDDDDDDGKMNRNQSDNDF